MKAETDSPYFKYGQGELRGISKLAHSLARHFAYCDSSQKSSTDFLSQQAADQESCGKWQSPQHENQQND